MIIVLVIAIAFFSGYFSRKYVIEFKDRPTEEEIEEKEKQKKKAKKIQKQFNELMEYDYDVAVKGSDINE